MKTRTSVFESTPDSQHRIPIIVLMTIVLLLALFGTSVACRLLDPDRDWPQAEPSSPEPMPSLPSS